MKKQQIKLGALTAATVGLLVAANLPTTVAQADTKICTTYQPGQISYDLRWETGTAAVRNTTGNCTFKITLAAYQTYLPYTSDPNNREWLYTQKYVDSETVFVTPGQRYQFRTLKTPACTAFGYQLDIFRGDKMEVFGRPGVPNPNPMPSDGWPTYIIGWSNTMSAMPKCQPAPTIVPTVQPTIVPTVQPTVVPTVKPTCVPSINPTVQPTITPTVVPSVVPTVEPTIEPTIEPTSVPTVTPTPEQVLSATTTPTPQAPMELPNTGPGAATIITLIGMIGALLGKKFTSI